MTANVQMLDIQAIVAGRPMVIHPTLLADDSEMILVDTGFPGQLPQIQQALAAAGTSLQRLTKIILTHQDIDHIGSLPDILKEARQSIEVLATSAEQPFIQGERRLLKITPEVIERTISALPPEMPAAMRSAIRTGLENPPRARVDRTIADGGELADCGGITAIITPGHTPGHLCLYHQPSKTLIAGDAMRAVDGRLSGPDPSATLELAMATASLKKLASYDIQRVICYHGGLVEGDVNRQIADLANR